MTPTPATDRKLFHELRRDVRALSDAVTRIDTTLRELVAPAVAEVRELRREADHARGSLGTLRWIAWAALTIAGGGGILVMVRGVVAGA